MVYSLLTIDPTPDPADVSPGWASSAIVVLLFLAIAVLWFISLVDALRRPDPHWTAAGQSKLVFVLLMVFLGPLESLLYLFIARPSLQRVREK